MLHLFLASALGYDLSDSNWVYQEAPIDEPFFLNTDTFAGVGGAAEVEESFRFAIDEWNSMSGADLYIEYGGTTDAIANPGKDDENVAWYREATSAEEFGIASWGYQGADILDCDIAFYEASETDGPTDWNFGENDSAPGQADFRRVVIHELGHCLGIWHSEDNTALMFADQPLDVSPEDRYLADDDRAAAQALYGEVRPELVVDEVALGSLDEIDAGTETTVDVSIENIGDGSAFFVHGTLTDADGAVSEFDVGNLGALTPVGLRVGLSRADLTIPWTATCSDAQDAVPFSVVLTDRFGNEWSETADVPVECHGGCGCSSSDSPVSALLVPGLAGLLSLCFRTCRPRRTS